MDRMKLKLAGFAGWWAILVLLVLAATWALADTPAPKRPFQKPSPNSRVVLDMRPIDTIGDMGRWEGTARTRDGRELWRVWWFAFPSKLVLLDDGAGMVRLGPWATRFQDLGDLAVAFYQRGRSVREYQVADLVRDRSKLIRTASHYFWMDREYATALSEDQRRFSIFTLDGGSYHFDTSNGELIRLPGENRKIAKARRLFVQGQKLYNQGRKPQALEKIKSSYRIWPNLLLRPVMERLLNEQP